MSDDDLRVLQENELEDDHFSLIMFLIFAPFFIAALGLEGWQLFYFDARWHELWKRYKTEGDRVLGRVYDRNETVEYDKDGVMVKVQHVTIECNVVVGDGNQLIRRNFEGQLSKGAMGCDGKPSHGCVSNKTFAATSDFDVLVLPGFLNSGFPDAEVDLHLGPKPWSFYPFTVAFLALSAYPGGLFIFFLDSEQDKLIGGLVTGTFYVIMIPCVFFIYQREHRRQVQQTLETLIFK
jgi:hypothetical protein